MGLAGLLPPVPRGSAGSRSRSGSVNPSAKDARGGADRQRMHDRAERRRLSRPRRKVGANPRRPRGDTPQVWGDSSGPARPPHRWPGASERCQEDRVEIETHTGRGSQKPEVL
jgi:hypothetical protein